MDGLLFEEVLISFPDAIPCGVKVAAYGGKIILNPDDSYVLQEGDEILVIAEDDDTYAPTTLPMVIFFPLYHEVITIKYYNILISTKILLLITLCSMKYWISCLCEILFVSTVMHGMERRKRQKKRSLFASGQ